MKNLIPTRYDSLIDLGGSTKPWKVFAIIDDENVPIEKPYVVKLFSPSQAKQHPGIAKEFICNALANDFDLFVPTAGIINLNETTFLRTLSRREQYILKQKFDGNTFASELLNASLVNEQMRGLISIEETAMIYAFDCFILNIDRWGFRKKPNLMIYNGDAMLIDHELTFSFIDSESRKTLDQILKAINEKRLIYPFTNHLFFNLLRAYKGNKEILFDTFQEYLRSINLGELKRLIDKLQANDIDVGATELLFEYIRELKGNSKHFSNTLLNTIL
ncbi:HipA family kinase [Mucilaginibacter sp.]|uniref:HipA family kinase n=1 Tax=Mucilaginibacter sp. TaxID=1882438 RepID=UPI002D1D919E|nr:HipA family kinase [Mucilaginibacter sp.]HTI61112.1 HipA family kinase [Mucilaginibacter sp.]